MNNNKKGQAAMEFLMTYGWAILAAIIAIGVLAYFGVFNPGRLAGPAGLVSPPFNLDDFNMVNDGGGAGQDQIRMVITQNLGSSLTLELQDGSADGFEVVLPDSTACTEAELVTVPAQLNVIDAATPVAWTSGTQVTLTANCGSKWAAGDAVRADITVRYKKGTAGLVQVTQGNVRGPSQ